MKTVTAAILIVNENIFIAQRQAHDALSSKWEFPGGKLEEGETLQECLKREMKEEFGMEISVGALFGESVYHYDHGSITLIAYWIQWEAGECTPKVHQACRWVPLKDLPAYDFAPADVPFVDKLCGGRT